MHIHIVKPSVSAFSCLIITFYGEQGGYKPFLVTNPGYMKDNMKIELKTWHRKGAGLENNVHELDNWKSVEVVQIDIANDKVSNADYRKETDPK